MPVVAPLVFVSSTSQDLDEYRAAIQRYLPCLDVLYRGMEYFFSRPERPWDVIRKEIMASDIVVLIVANRYGSLLPGDHMSYTEAEYRFAREQQKPALAFLIDPRQPVEPNTVESGGDTRRRLQAFRALIQKDGTVASPFTTQEDLVLKVGHSLTKWLQDTAGRWKNRLHVPLDDRESEYIAALYSRDADVVARAVDRLSRPDCRAAHEHMFSRLHDPNLRPDIARAMLHHFLYAHDWERTSQILCTLLEQVPWLRPQVAYIIGERARLKIRSVGQRDFDAIIRLENSDDPETRAEVAHAIGKMGAGNPEWYDRSMELLRRHSTDPEEQVRAKANNALIRMPAR